MHPETAKPIVMILKDNVLEYVSLRGSDQDVDKETRRFVAASKDSAVKDLSKNSVYDRADMVKILTVATVGEIREYERSAWVYIPERPRDHPSLIRFYKKYHPVRYLETVIHGYPEHFSEEDVLAAPKTLPKSFIEYLLRRGCAQDIIIMAEALSQHFTDQYVPGVPTLTKPVEPEEFDKNVHGFLTTLKKMGLHVGVEVFAQALSLNNPRFIGEYLAFEKYMHSANASNYNINDAQKAANLLAEGFQNITPPDEPLARMPDPNFPPTEVAEEIEYFLYYGNESEVRQLATKLITHLRKFDFSLKFEIERFRSKHDDGSRDDSRSDLQTTLTFVNPRTVERYHRIVRTNGFLTPFVDRSSQTPPDIRNHPALARYYRRNFVINYIDSLSHDSSTPLKGALLLDEIEAMCPANLQEHCLQYGTEKEVHEMVKALTRKYETPHLVKKKKKGGLYTRGDLRLMLKELSQKNPRFDPNEHHGVYKAFTNYGALMFNVFNEIFLIKYASQKERDDHIRIEFARGNLRIRSLIEGFGSPPYSKEQHRAVMESVAK
jgi:hypothetical protein